MKNRLLAIPGVSAIDQKTVDALVEESHLAKLPTSPEPFSVRLIAREGQTYVGFVILDGKAYGARTHEALDAANDVLLAVEGFKVRVRTNLRNLGADVSDDELAAEFDGMGEELAQEELEPGTLDADKVAKDVWAQVRHSRIAAEGTP